MNETRTEIDALIRKAVETGSRSLELWSVDLRNLADMRWTLERIIEELPNVESVDFSNTRFGLRNAGLQALAGKAKFLAALRSLKFSGTRLDNGGLRALANRAKDFRVLQSLDFSNTQVRGVRGIKVLATQAQHLPALQSLNFSQTQVSDAGLQAFATQARHLPALQSLNFSGTQVSDVGLQSLAAQAEHLLALQSLDFSGTQVSDVGLQALAAHAQHLPELLSLDFSRTRVSDAGLQALAEQAGHFHALQHLNVSHTRVNVPEEILASRFAARIFEHVLGRERLLPEVKLLLVGQGEVGKTHLRKRLFNEPVDPIYHDVNEDRTHDIEMTIWKTKVEVGDRGQTARGGKNEAAGKQTQTTDVLCRVWDFGGQDYLHGSHRFFVGAERCLYLLVLNATQNAEQNRLDYWLRFLAHHGCKQSGSGKSTNVERAPVLIVLTQCDRWELEGTTDNGVVDLINALAIAKRDKWYDANVVACIGGFGWSDEVERPDQPLQQEVKQRHTTAVERIVEELQQHIPDVLGLKYQFTPGFFAMKQWIEDYFPRDPAAATAKHFNWKEYPAFCDACEEANLSEGLREDYLKVCRSLGLAHWVGDVPEIANGTDTYLKELVFNPEWVKRPVYELIRSHPDNTNRRGWMSNDNLRVWFRATQLAPLGDDHLYRRLPFTQGDYDHIQKLMLACRVAFRVEDRPDLANGLLIPDLLEARERKIPKHEFRAQWMGEESLSFRHLLKFLPERVFLRFIADHYQRINDLQEDCWRDEVIVPYFDITTNTTCEVLVQSELSPLPGEQPYLAISIRGGLPADRKLTASKVFDDFRKILSREVLDFGRIERDETMREQDTDEVQHARVHGNSATDAVIAEPSQSVANESRTSATSTNTSDTSREAITVNDGVIHCSGKSLTQKSSGGLTPTEWRLFMAFWPSRGKWITKEDLYKAATGDDFKVTDHTHAQNLQQHISRLRTKLNRLSHQINLEPNAEGYRLVIPE